MRKGEFILLTLLSLFIPLASMSTGLEIISVIVYLISIGALALVVDELDHSNLLHLLQLFAAIPILIGLITMVSGNLLLALLYIAIGETSFVVSSTMLQNPNQLFEQDLWLD